MIDEVKLSCSALRVYAKQYADGTTLGRAIEDTEIIMRDAADLLEAQAERIAELEDAIDKARRIISNSLSTDRCDYCDNREKYPQECDGYCNECKLDCVCKGCTLVSGRF